MKNRILVQNRNLNSYSCSIGIYPVDSQPFEEKGRISAYVRFPYSEFLDFSNIEQDSISFVARDSIAASGFNSHYYDPALKVRNKKIVTGARGIEVKLDKQFDDLSDSYVFVKCEIAERFYHTPRVVKRRVKVFLRELKEKLLQNSHLLLKIRLKKKF